MIMNIRQTLGSTDIYLCSFCLSMGAVLERVERDESGRVHFLLHAEGSKGMDELVRLYWSNEPVPIVPSRLLGSLKHLKGLLYSHP